MNLNVNIDHVATLRQARGGVEPEPITAALIAELAGATGIVCHLREDRRHINDRDLKLLRSLIQTKLDLEMAATPEIIQIAIDTKPDLVTIVPEKRQELTTEGGLDLTQDTEKFEELCNKMHENGIEVSFFVEPDKNLIQIAKDISADMVELHTGVYANAKTEKEKLIELEKIQTAAEFASKLGLKVAAGHGLNYFNTPPIAAIKYINELSIGHSIISRAIFVGIERAVKEMIELINRSI